MKTEIVENGLFKVNEVGEIWRRRKDQWVLATQIKTGKGGRYRIVTAQVNGVQKRFYVHRLIAEAFIPNPDGKPEVNHKDGNPWNNRAENLEWCTRSENATHAYRTGLVNPYLHATPCKKCGLLTNSKDGLCTSCKMELKKEARQIEKKIQIREDMSSICLDRISERTSIYIELRKNGLTYRQIADAFGVSRQCVQQAIAIAEAKSGTPAKVSASAKNEFARLTRKLLKNDDKIRFARAELDRLNDENEKIRLAIADLEESLTVQAG